MNRRSTLGPSSMRVADQARLAGRRRIATVGLKPCRSQQASRRADSSAYRGFAVGCCTLSPCSEWPPANERPFHNPGPGSFRRTGRRTECETLQDRPYDIDWNFTSAPAVVLTFLTAHSDYYQAVPMGAPCSCTGQGRSLPLGSLRCGPGS